MAIIRAQVTLPHDNGLPEDAAVNTFHFSSSDLSTGVLESVSAAVVNVYNGQSSNAGGLLAPLGDHIASSRANPCSVKLYDAVSAPPNIPLRTQTFSISGAGQTDFSLPAEVALCGSFQGTPTSGTDQARRRGRIYFGPLDAASLAASASDGFPSLDLRQSLLAALLRLRQASENSTTWDWGVYSKGSRNRVLQPDGTMRATGSLRAPIFTPVTDVWVDDRFDTQRRRGTKPTSKMRTIPNLVL